MKKSLDNQTIYRHIIETNSNVKRYLNLAPSLRGINKRVTPGENPQPIFSPKMLLKPNS
ncbi:MAG: hypothetical protein M0T74_02935 [Desulfitobacterium hafniense]|nr:hypothetical protein [Desulfitobacterium hafniense]